MRVMLERQQARAAAEVVLVGVAYILISTTAVGAVDGAFLFPSDWSSAERATGGGFLVGALVQVVLVLLGAYLLGLKGRAERNCGELGGFYPEGVDNCCHSDGDSHRYRHAVVPASTRKGLGVFRAESYPVGGSSSRRLESGSFVSRLRASSPGSRGRSCSRPDPAFRNPFRRHTRWLRRRDSLGGPLASRWHIHARIILRLGRSQWSRKPEARDLLPHAYHRRPATLAGVGSLRLMSAFHPRRRLQTVKAEPSPLRATPGVQITRWRNLPKLAPETVTGVPMLRIFGIIVAMHLSGCSKAAGVQPTTIGHPNEPSAVVEYFVERPTGRGPWPTVVFLHGHQRPMRRIGGRAFADWGVLRKFAGKGYLAVSISLPGYGGSSGPEDFAGPFTQDAVKGVLAKLKADRQAIPTKILLQGVSLGAVTSALVAAEDHDIVGLVLISGLYDLPAFFDQERSVGALAVKASAYQLTGGSQAALRSRSALFKASEIRATTLIINGAKDDRTDAQQATNFAAAIRAHGRRAKAHIFPDFGHEIPVQARDAEIDDFIDTTLRK